MKKRIIFFSVCLVFFGASLSQARAQGVKLGFAGGLGLPIGDFENAFEAGFGLQGDVKFFVKEPLAVALDVGYHAFSREGRDADDDRVDMFPIRLGVDYYFAGGGVTPYIAGGLGGYIHERNGDFIGDRDSDTEIGLHLRRSFVWHRR